MNYRSEAGLTILELLAAIGLMAVLSGIAVTNLRVVNKPLQNAASSAELLLQLARSKAISGTQIIKVKPKSSTVLAAFSGTTCSGATTPVPNLSQALPSGTSLSDQTWYICFNSRGQADASISFNINDMGRKTKTIKIARGGGVKIQK
jgi:Tfp pilus assembly protein FimT